MGILYILPILFHDSEDPPSLIIMDKWEVWMVIHEVKIPFTALWPLFRASLVRQWIYMLDGLHGPTQTICGVFPAKFHLMWQLFMCKNHWRFDFKFFTLSWRHHEGHGVSNHRRLQCLFNRMFRRESKKRSKFRVTLYEGDPTMTSGFPSQRAGNAETISILWQHHGEPSPSQKKS